MIEIIQSIILGIVQGLTEFLPISSSAHLNLLPWMFHWDTISESFDVALHFGTLLAICIFFWKDWMALLKGGFLVVKKDASITKEEKQNGTMFWYIVEATIPAGILSLLLDTLSDTIIGDNFTLEMGLIGLALMVMGVILYYVDQKSGETVKYEEITRKQSLLIGTSQAIAAAFPGVSRSGITMTVSRAMGLDRESAAKFSFLLSAPIIAAAVVFDLPHFVFSVPFFLGVLASFVTGLLVIRFLMAYLKKGSYRVFAIYRILLGLVVFGYLWFTRG